MMPRRPLLVLVILAALYGAPSPSFAAANELSAPTVTPATGSASTLFTFAVRYDGRSAATAVTAQVAGLTLPMHLSSGTLLGGTWTGAWTLPPGTWPVTFVASVERRNAPTIAGPTVTVAGHGTAVPSTPAVTPKPGAAPPPAGERVSGGAMSAGSGTDAAGTDAAGTGASAGSEPAVAEVASGVRAGSPADIAAEHASDTWETGDGLVVSVLLLGLAGVAAVALIGTAILLAARRRGDEKEEAVSEALAEASSVMQRPAARRAKLDYGDDPILVSLGLGGDDEPTRRRRRVGRQIARGGGGRSDRTPPT